MTNSNSILIKARKQATQLAKDVAKSGSRELLEIPKQAPRELMGAKIDKPSPIVEAMQQTESSTSGISLSGLKRVENINQEMTRLRKLHKEEVNKSQQRVVGEEDPKLSEPGKPLLPTSPARGPKIHATEKHTRIESKPGKD